MTTAIGPWVVAIEMLPVTFSEPFGEKVTFSVAFCPGVMVNGVAIPLACTSVALTVTFDNVTLEVPALLIVTLFDVELPAFMLPKDRLVGLAFITSVAATPAPDRETVVGELGALLEMETLPASVPLVVGANSTVNAALWPAGIVVGVANPGMLYPVPLIEI